MTTDVYIIGTCGCGGRIIAPILKSKHFRPQLPVCERSGTVSLECALAPPDVVIEVPDTPTNRHFIMESR